MRVAHWLIAAALGLLFGGCVSTQTTLPTQARQALAPTGQLRVAFLSGVLYATKDTTTGELKGVAVDLGREVARRMGMPFQPVLYPNPAAIIAGAKSGEWDVALMGINAERAAAVDFSAPYMEVEQGYLVRVGVPVTTASEVDKPGIRIAVIEKAGADLHLSSTLKNATLVHAKNVGELDVYWSPGKRTWLPRPRRSSSRGLPAAPALESSTADSSSNRSAWGCPRDVMPSRPPMSASSLKRQKRQASSSPQSIEPACEVWSSLR